MRIKNKIKYSLRKHSSLYKLIQGIYGKALFLKEALLNIDAGEKEEKRWRNRHLKEGSDWIIKGYWGNKNDPHRTFLLKEIEGLFPFDSILEIGCNCGPNLYLIAKKFPKTKIRGIDINSEAIRIGNKLMKKENISNVNLSVGEADNLKNFSDKSFDIVFIDAVLAHVGPQKTKKIIREMLRIAKKALIFVEWHDERASDMGTRMGYSHRWKRNYRLLLSHFVKEEKIQFVDIPKESWSEGWKDVIKVIL